MKQLKNAVDVCLLALLLVLAAGCGKQAETAENTLTGTLDEVKSFQFVVTDNQGNSYSFPIEAGREPEGLSQVQEGDRVTVTYTGKLTVVDRFTGEVLSVQAAS